MTQKPVPEEVRRFVLDCIPSVPCLEALLLLRSEPQRTWDSFGLGARLYIGERDALQTLQALQCGGIACRTAEGRYAFAPAAEVARTVDALAATYAHDLVGVTDLIHSGAHL